jgi:hypothetical protein
MVLTLCTVSTVSAADAFTIISISDKGVFPIWIGQAKTQDVQTMFTEKQPLQLKDPLTISSDTVDLKGPVVGEEEISIFAKNFRFQHDTVFGTNGNLTLNFTNSLSPIKSITLYPSDITITHNGEELHIGSVWGNLTGALSSDVQLILLRGYSEISIQESSGRNRRITLKK